MSVDSNSDDAGTVDTPPVTSDEDEQLVNHGICGPDPDVARGAWEDVELLPASDGDRVAQIQGSPDEWIRIDAEHVWIPQP